MLIKAKADKLIQYLIEEHDKSVDPTFLEDFLLMYRTFVANPLEVFERLLLSFNDVSMRDRIVRIVLHWANNHYNDFETNSEMMKRLEEFEKMLENEVKSFFLMTELSYE